MSNQYQAETLINRAIKLSSVPIFWSAWYLLENDHTRPATRLKVKLFNALYMVSNIPSYQDTANLYQDLLINHPHMLDS